MGMGCRVQISREAQMAWVMPMSGETQTSSRDGARTDRKVQRTRVMQAVLEMHLTVRHGAGVVMQIG